MNPLPLLYVLGDSISIQYGPYLEKNLEGVVRYDRKGGLSEALLNLDNPAGANGGDSRMAWAFLQDYLPKVQDRPDYLLLNCGLHDIKRSLADMTIQVDLNEYRKNLGAMLGLCRDHGVNLVWLKSTPVVDKIHRDLNKDFARFDVDLQAYNDIADDLMEKEGVPLIDLHAFTLGLGPVEELFSDHVHFTEWVREKQGQFIAGEIRQLLGAQE